jgi:hypothetical protein
MLTLDRRNTIDVGARDYYGNTMPHSYGTGFNVGADGGRHP